MLSLAPALEKITVLIQSLSDQEPIKIEILELEILLKEKRMNEAKDKLESMLTERENNRLGLNPFYSLVFQVLKDLQSFLNALDLDDIEQVYGLTESQQYRFYQGYQLIKLLESSSERMLADNQEMHINAESFCTVMGLVSDLINPKQITGIKKAA